LAAHPARHEKRRHRPAARGCDDPEADAPALADALRFAWLRIPHERILTVDQRLAHAAARPVIYPETLLFDHGKSYKSDVVTRACRRLGISIQDARMFTPTDKPRVAYCTSPEWFVRT
jgi:hypothetical protein